MYKIAKIDFKPIIKDRDIALDKIDDILGMLIKNGQILDECNVEDHNDHYIANVITTDDDSLDTKYFNQYIKNEIKINTFDKNKNNCSNGFILL